MAVHGMAIIVALCIVLVSSTETEQAILKTIQYIVLHVHINYNNY